MKTRNAAFIFLWVFLFMGVFARFIASPYPIIVYDKKERVDLPRFPILHSIFSNDLKSLKTEYRTLVNRNEIGALFTIIPYSPYENDLVNYLNPPSSGRFGHYLGTDETGRDVAARLVHGTTNSMMVSIVAVGIALFIGIFIGTMAGYFGGWVDIGISRFIEVIICFPKLILIIAVLALRKPSIWNLMLVIGLTSWTDMARLIRGEVLKIKNFDYVQATRAMGSGHFRIMFWHILPGTIGPLSVTAAFDVAGAVLTESALSFLGIGVPLPEPSWGDVLKTAQDFPDLAWWMTLFPGFLIFMTIITFNDLGEKLRRRFARES